MNHFSKSSWKFVSITSIKWLARMWRLFVESKLSLASPVSGYFGLSRCCAVESTPVVKCTPLSYRDKRVGLRSSLSFTNYVLGIVFWEDHRLFTLWEELKAFLLTDILLFCPRKLVLFTAECYLLLKSNPFFFGPQHQKLLLTFKKISNFL